MVDLFGLKEFGIEFAKTLVVGGTIVGIPIYKILKKNKDTDMKDLMIELGIQNKKGKVPLVIDKSEAEYGYNYVFHVPEGKSIKDFENNIAGLQNVLDGEIQFEDLGKQRVLMRVVTNKLEKNYPYEHEELSLMKFFIGYTYYGKLYLTLSNDDVHMLVGGGMGKGKSSFLRLLISQMIANDKNNMIQLHLCDLARKEFVLFENSSKVKNIAYDINDTIKVLYELKDIMLERSKEFKDGINDIYKYNKAHPDNPWCFHVCFIDEFADLILTQDKKESIVLQFLLAELLRKGRSVGIHFILSTQHPNAETVPSLIKKHLFIRIAFAVSDRYASDAILDHNGAEQIRITGRAIIKDSSGEKEFQALYLDEEAAMTMIKDTIIDKEVEEVKEIIGVKRSGNSKKRQRNT